LTNSDLKSSACAHRFTGNAAISGSFNGRPSPRASADALLERMLTTNDGLCAERDKLKKALAGPTKGKVLGGQSWA
jgi:hypothetical protein